MDSEANLFKFLIYRILSEFVLKSDGVTLSDPVS